MMNPQDSITLSLRAAKLAKDTLALVGSGMQGGTVLKLQFQAIRNSFSELEKFLHESGVL